MLTKCDICGLEVKNLGVHKYHKHSKKEEVQELIVDEITDKPLSELISEMKNLVKGFRNEIDVRVSDKRGKTSEIEIRVRIQV